MKEFDTNTKKQDEEHTKQPLNGELRNMRWRGDPMLEGIRRLTGLATTHHEPITIASLGHPRIDDLPEVLKDVIAAGGSVTIHQLGSMRVRRES